jgi:hypothetical protein
MVFQEEYYQQFIGQKFNRLTILEYVGSLKGRPVVKAECDCGAIKKYLLKNIKRNNTKSCGCFRIKKHGLWDHHLYKRWITIKSRCYNPNATQYNNYGGSGVTMCEEWKNNFKSFYDWCIENGWKEGLEVDKDLKYPGKTGKIYSPEYCCLVTHEINNRNRSNNVFIEYDEQNKCLKEWSCIIGIDYSTLRSRLRSGWTVKEAFTIPTKKSA